MTGTTSIGINLNGPRLFVASGVIDSPIAAARVMAPEASGAGADDLRTDRGMTLPGRSPEGEFFKTDTKPPPTN